MANNIRDAFVLGNIIGKKVVDITQDDWDDTQQDGSVAVYLHFENGTTLKFFTDRNKGFEYDGADDGAPVVDKN